MSSQPLILSFVVNATMCDHNQHLNHKEYLFFYEESRTKYMEALSGKTVADLQADDLAFFITDISVKYRGEIFANQTISVKTTPVKLGPVYQYQQEIYDGEKLLSTCECRGVIVYFSSKKIISRAFYQEKMNSYYKRDR